ncbi:MAG: NADH-quinone oxidoreductase subunit M [Alphaproteobacteria bacterium]|nr:MAG: NADH-quinone oxidoreductase subunit M [Alphaproteobacteria bacterium]
MLMLLTFLPLLGVAVIAASSRLKGAEAVARWSALVTSIIGVVLAAWALRAMPPGCSCVALSRHYEWLPHLGLIHIKGIDGFSAWFIMVTAILVPLSILASWRSITQRVPLFMSLLLVLETALLGAFTTLDLVAFYVFFEGTLVPMFLLIALWGGPARRHAAFKFFLFTFAGSVLMLVAMIALYLHTGSADMTAIPRLLSPGQQPLPPEISGWIWAAFFLALAIKMPLWPMHTWLPYAHVEAPTAGSMLLAGILLKLGGYGMIRFLLQMMPGTSLDFSPLVMGLAVIAIVYASLVALTQSDMKKLVAYSSVAHMGFAVLGLFSFTPQGLQGAMLVMISHALVSAGLFYAVGVLYERRHSRDIADYGGLAGSMPRFAVALMLLTLASIGLPGTSGFVGEFLALQGAFISRQWAAAGGALGMVLGAAYMLILYRRLVFTAPATPPAVTPDLEARETLIFVVLGLGILAMGLHPSFVQALFAPGVDDIVAGALALTGTGS